MEKNTIGAAIVKVLKASGKPLNPKDIYEAIKKANLYQFEAKQPEGIVRNQLRRHSENVKLPASSSVKYFVSLDDGTYWLKDTPVPKG